MTDQQLLELAERRLQRAHDAEDTPSATAHASIAAAAAQIVIARNSLPITVVDEILPKHEYEAINEAREKVFSKTKKGKK